jgi:methionyl-tRNA formyltransferase
MPWPGVYSFWNGKKIDFYDIEVLQKPDLDKNPKPGLVLEKNGQIFISTKKGYVSPKYLKLEGKNKVPTDDFLRGYPEFIKASL